MLSVSSNILQSQVLLPISYAISQYSGLRTSATKSLNHEKKSRPIISESHSASELNLAAKDIDFIEDFAKRVSESKILLHDFALTGNLESNIEHYYNLPFRLKSFPSSKSIWRESHVSFNTFTENKNFLPGICPNSCSVNISLSKKVLRKLSSPHSFFARSFKTQHSIERKVLQQQAFVDRFKQGLRLKDSASSFNPDSDTKLKLGKLLKEETNEESQRNIKVAFAEGYLAAEPKKEKSRFMKILQNFQNVVAFITVISLLFLVWGSLGGSVFRMHVRNGSEVKPEDINVTFEDVKGAEEAKQELKEIVQFLKDPHSFTTLGAELPKGVLLVGPPGTGKTLLARAIAGEAGVPFFHAAGPEFDEILVGQGARRVRDLFMAAKLKAPCVVFIDEIDSVGAKRTNSVLHPYANQTINQLLSEMDGFHENEGVIVLGATNRRDDLDKALLRPGRFDVEVQVPVPDFSGRKEIFEYYLGKVKRGEDVDAGALSRGTVGFTGADIKNVVNQAALRAAADHIDSVSMKYLEEARDKSLMGPEKKSRIPDEEANLITAYHEGGHTLVAFYTKNATPLHKVTIIPRGSALGHTAFIPDKEHYHVTRCQVVAQIDSLMGGRAAEELIFGSDMMTCGAANDLQRATGLATMMVKDAGMSDKVGVRTFENNSNQLLKASDSLSQATKEAIDAEIKRILQESYERAKSILKTHSKEHKALADALMKYETLDANDIKSILEGRTVDKNS